MGLIEADLIQFVKQLTEENRNLYGALMDKDRENMELKRVIGQFEGINKFLEFRLSEAERRIQEYEQR